MRRTPRAVGLAATVALLAGLAAVAAPSVATTPSGLTIPSSPGQKVTATFSGTIPAGVNANSDCTGAPASTISENTIAINVPAGVYDAVDADTVFQITWSPVVTGTTSDEILTVLKPDGSTLGSSDTGDPTETVAAGNPDAGTYKIQACGFANAQPQPYKGTVTITTKAHVASAQLPLADPKGLQFSATVPSDPQRDEGEPAVTTDRAGNLYTCGPTGFTTTADYAQVSTDGGDQFHLLGTPPRGQISAGEGGGDCALGTGIKKNAKGNYQLAYAGLGPLTNFSTATSADVGKTLVGSSISESVPGVDRQWIAFSDDKTAFLTYNQQALNKIVQKSTDGGLTYNTPGATAANEGGRIGQIRAFLPPGVTDPAKAFVYLPYSAGTKVKIALSQDGGSTFSQCVAVDAGVDPTAGFVAADNDDQGNVYVTYTEKGGGRDTYLVTAPFSVFKNCKGPNPASQSAKNATNPGFSKKIQLNRGGVETTVMPWVAASGVPGSVAVAYYGTTAKGDPNVGTFKAAWYVFVNQITDALSATPHVAQVRATTHPSHYDSICLNGLGCDINMGDRSLVDYFTMEYNRGTKALNIVYSNAGKKPDEAEGHVATPSVITQVAGPSNGGGTVSRPGRAPLRTSSPDPAGDALTDYSFLNIGAAVVTPTPTNVPALDLVDRGGPAVAVTPENSTPQSGFVVTMRLKDLSAAALQSALTSGQLSTPGSLVYAFRFVDGYQSAAAVARYDAVQGWEFGYNGYATAGAGCLSSSMEKCLIYPGDENTGDGRGVTGKVDAAAGTITLTVPQRLLKALGPPDSSGQRPTEVDAKAGSRIYDATVFTFLNPSPVSQEQGFMTQVDNAPAFDFLLAANSVRAPTTTVPDTTPTSPDAPPPGGGGLAATGLAWALPAFALLLLIGGVGIRRRTAR
ncbi:MAG: hypothetical protein LC789_11435 [Actinobacteria bacterium]|nr:hypothetical protein [Actinomycetota bacterium]MCA1720615.1 hypothetical protein [Actinomycetota bacterium]